jgi:outer membrane biosynthesis protein TonB
MNLSCRSPRLFVCLFALGLGALSLSIHGQTPGGQPAAVVQVTTIKRSAVKVGNSAFALVKGTKLEVLGREGKDLIVKYRTSQGKIPYADTDYVLSEEEQAEVEEAAATPPPATPAKPPATPAPKPTTVKTPPPALSVDKKPASNYGKMVQKAKQAEQAHNDKLVKPADEILDEKPKK